VCSALLYSVVVRLVVKVLNLTMSGSSQERATREYCASELSKNVGKVKFETCLF